MHACSDEESTFAYFKFLIDLDILTALYDINIFLRYF